MQDLAGKVAFVTGAASGIGLAIARSMHQSGMRVMLADIDADGLAQAASELEGSATVICDVRDPASVKAAADATIETFGKVHAVVNNAGVGLGGSPGSIPLEDWRWIVDINLMGVVHGVEIFTPLIRSHGEGGHFINTASMAGHWGHPNMGPYCATKFAVVGYSECLHEALAPEGIGVSVLCPGFVKTNIANGGVNRPSGVEIPRVEPEGGDKDGVPANASDLVANGMPPEVLGDWVVECMQRDARYIFTHPDMAPLIEGRHEMIRAEFARSAANATLMANQTSQG
ncbi:MAG: SDR family NAD(P)-dependent oxidoreductase [Minwuia sp.]|nr:SDR family NAD(P)-dependent oxidoreductase [Minwuia sp.]